MSLEGWMRVIHESAERGRHMFGECVIAPRSRRILTNIRVSVDPVLIIWINRNGIPYAALIPYDRFTSTIRKHVEGANGNRLTERAEHLSRVEGKCATFPEYVRDLLCVRDAFFYHPDGYEFAYCTPVYMLRRFEPWRITIDDLRGQAVSEVFIAGEC